MIDFEQLCIEEGEKIWMACIDLHIMDHGGNLFDCCTAAAVAALHQTMMPNVQYNVGEKPKDEKMNISLKPITCTFAKIGEAVVLDPNLDEEKVMSARLTVSPLKAFCTLIAVYFRNKPIWPGITIAPSSKR